MSFDFVPKRQFFDLLFKDSGFCEGVGRVILAAGMLETNLRRYLVGKGLVLRRRRTLGSMVKLMKENRLLSQNGTMHFDDLTLKRNYLAHSLYDLFSEQIEETILPSSELVEMDIDIFRERANQLAEDFFHFSNLVGSADVGEDLLL